MAHIPGHMGIQGQGLQLNIVGCRNLADKEWFSRQDPYVIIEYANNKFKTRTDRDGGKNPKFNERFTIPLIEGLREINLHVWNSNIVQLDDYIGSAKVLLEKVLSTGYDDSAWVLKSKTGKTAGEVNLILHYSNLKTGKEDKYGAASYSAYPPSAFPPAQHGAQAAYPSPYGATSGYPPAHGAHAAGPTGYAPAPVQSYPPAPSYPHSQSYHSAPTGYPPASGYPPHSSHGTTYPPTSGYPPAPEYPPSGYPPGPPQNSYTSAPRALYPAPYPGSTPHAPAGYPSPPPSGYGAPQGGHKAGKVHVGSSGHYKQGKHKKHKGSKFGKKYKGSKGKGWKGKK